MVHDVRRESPPFGGSFRTAALPFGYLRVAVVRTGRQLCWPMLKGRRVDPTLGIWFGRGDVQRKGHVHSTGRKYSGLCLFGDIVVPPVTSLQTTCVAVCSNWLRSRNTTLRTRGTLALTSALLRRL